MDPHSAAAWLLELQRDRLIVTSPRIVLDVEQLLRVYVERGVQDPVEIGHGLASLLAKDEQRYRQILEHYHRTFFIFSAAPREEPRTLGAEKPRVIAPVWAETRGLRSQAWREWFSSRVRRFTQRFTGRTWVFVVAVFFVVGILALPKVMGVVERLDPRLREHRVAVAWMTPFFKPPPPPPPKELHIELTRGEVRHPAEVLQEPEAKPPFLERFTPRWLSGLLAAISALFALGVARLWSADREYAADLIEAERRAEQERARLMASTTILGVPYHIERAPPFHLPSIDDAATLLGRMARPEEGFALDVPATIDRTIEAGGRIAPVFARGHRRDAVLIWVDIENGSHPYLHGVEWLLERWKRQGVQFIRYDFRGRPTSLLRYPDHREVTLDSLGRRLEGMPLLILSRMAMPQEYSGRLDWLQKLTPWPNRAWLDLDPRTRGERAKDELQILVRLSSRWPRFPWTPKGLIACATFLAGGGRKTQEPKEEPMADGPEVQQALFLWAAAAACVPDPTWEHLDSLRRGLEEVRDVLPDARYVRRLVDWVRRFGYGAETLGTGPALWFDEEKRSELQAKLRIWDAQQNAKNAEFVKVEDRTRRLLIEQLKAADAEGDAFAALKRDMKRKVHEAILNRESVGKLLAEFGDSAVAEELRRVLKEEIETQGVVLEKEQGVARVDGFSEGQIETVRGYLSAGEGEPKRARVRLSDFWRWGQWSVQRGELAAAAVAVVGASWAGFFALAWKPAEAKVAVAVVVEPAEYRLEEEMVALAELAPMRFVRLPGGIFMMGSPDGEVERDEHEKRHEMEVFPFAIATHEVTQKQWKEVMGTTPFDCDYGCGDAYPAQNVSWWDAVQFMNKLTDRENLHRGNNAPLTRCYEQTKWTWDRSCTGYRLPTEAEWEYAARAGTETVYSFGDDAKDLCQYGNGADQAAKRRHSDWKVNETCDDGDAYLAPVGTFKPNPWGLYDVHGNVGEWVWDKYAVYPEKVTKGYAGPDSDTDNVADNDNDSRVLRGGSFNYVPRGLRSSYRGRNWPTVTFEYVGFRCARGASPALIP